jgi:tetratricopeptide (TPR) repeat protein
LLTLQQSLKVVQGSLTKSVSLFYLGHMKIQSRLIIVLLVFFAACSTTKQFTGLDPDAPRALRDGEYQLSLELYEDFIERHQHDVLSIPDSIYRGAGLSAYHLGQSEKSLNYLNLIRHTETADSEVHYVLALLNREIDNLSREITALEMYLEARPEGDQVKLMKERLFVTYVESRNYEKALELWMDIEKHARYKEPLLNDYFRLQEALGNEDLLDDIAEDLLSLNSDNTDALYHLAKKYFWQAENRYQSEMEAYEQNRTHRQYAQLLRAFEILNADFHKSLNYFLRLYAMDPKPAYARYIGNIYLRFNDEGKARYYHGRAEG